MGVFSKAIFGRERLPSSCLIYAGAYLPLRKEWVRNKFDEWERVRGSWIRFTFSRKGDKEFLVVFNVYGSQLLLEVLHLLKDGESKKVFFAGSVGAKYLPVGALILPIEAIDKTGMVSVDDPERKIVCAEQMSLTRIRSILRTLQVDWTEGNTASVPCVLHDIKRVKDFVERENSIVGIDMELSNFIHFSQKLGLESGALVYVSDNKKHDVISSSRTVHEARRKSLRIITQVAIEFL